MVPSRWLRATKRPETMERILSAMDPDKRIAFLLMDIEEMKASEVAALLDMNVNTVYSRLQLARKQFQTLLARHSETNKRGAR